MAHSVHCRRVSCCRDFHSVTNKVKFCTCFLELHTYLRALNCQGRGEIPLPKGCSLLILPCMDMASHNSFTHVRAGVADYFSELTVVERVVKNMFIVIYLNIYFKPNICLSFCGSVCSPHCIFF